MISTNTTHSSLKQPVWAVCVHAAIYETLWPPGDRIFCSAAAVGAFAYHSPYSGYQQPVDERGVPWSTPQASRPLPENAASKTPRNSAPSPIKQSIMRCGDYPHHRPEGRRWVLASALGEGIPETRWSFEEKTRSLARKGWVPACNPGPQSFESAPTCPTPFAAKKKKKKKCTRYRSQVLNYYC